MDSVTSTQVDVKIQAALTPYRTRDDDDVLLATKATTATTAGLQTQITTLGDTVATKADAAAVYTKETSDQRLASAVSAASATADSAVQAVAQTLTNAVSTLNQNLANAQSTLNSQINAKVSTDAWPGLVIQAQAAAANSASAAVAQTTQDLEALVATRAPLTNPGFTGTVTVNGQAVVLTNDTRMSIRGPTGWTGPAGAAGAAGAAGPAGVASTGATGPAGAAGSGGGGAYGRYQVTTTTIAQSGFTNLYFATIPGFQTSGITLSPQSNHTGIVFDSAGVYVLMLGLRPSSSVTNNGQTSAMVIARWNPDASNWTDFQTSERSTITANNNFQHSFMIYATAGSRWRHYLDGSLNSSWTINTDPVFTSLAIFKVG